MLALSVFCGDVMDAPWFCIENRIREMADLIQVVVLDCDGNKLRRPDGTWETMEIGQSIELY